MDIQPLGHPGAHPPVGNVEVRVREILGAHPHLDRLFDRSRVDLIHVVGVATQVLHEVDKHPDVVGLAPLVFCQDRGAILLRALGVDGVHPPLLRLARARFSPSLDRPRLRR